MCRLPVRKLPLSGNIGKGKFVFVDGDYDGEYFAQYKWRLNPSTGYVSRKAQNKEVSKGKQIYLHHVVAGSPPPGKIVTFRNNNRLDCRSCNVCWTTYSDRSLTRKQPAVNSTGYRGVRKVSPNRWAAYLTKRYLGIFSSPQDAAHAYDIAAKSKYGDRAIVNFPTPQGS